MLLDDDRYLLLPTKYASPRLARAAASGDPDSRKIVDRLLELKAIRPDNARILDGLTPGEKIALERLQRNGLVIEDPVGFWWLNPIAWDERLDTDFHRHVWIAIVLTLVTAVLVWLHYRW